MIKSSSTTKHTNIDTDDKVKYKRAPLNKFGSSTSLLVGKTNKENALAKLMSTPLTEQPIFNDAIQFCGNLPTSPNPHIWSEPLIIEITKTVKIVTVHLRSWSSQSSKNIGKNKLKAARIIRLALIVRIGLSYL